MIKLEKNEILSNIKNDIFAKPLQQDIDTSVAQYQLQFQKEFYNFLFNGSKANNLYHESEIKQNNMLIKNIILLCWFSFLVESVIIVWSLIVGNTTIPIIAATSEAFINIIASVMIITLKQSIKNKKIFFEKSMDAEELSKIIGSIRALDNGNVKDKLTSLLVKNYCTKYNPKFSLFENKD